MLLNKKKPNPINKLPPKKSRALQDLIIILIFSIFVFFLASIIDFYEVFLWWSSKYKIRLIDELLIILLFTFIIYSWRRWSELKNEIKQHKLTQKELQRTENLYQILFENARDAIFIANIENGLILNANKQAQAMINRPRKKIIGMNYSQLFPPDEVNKSLFLSHTEVNQIISQPLYTEIFTSAGKKIPVEINSNIIELVNGEKINQIFFRDITERIKAQKALKQAKEKAELIYKVVPSAVFTVDKNCRILSWNDKAAEITGYSMNDVIGKKCALFAGTQCNEKCNLYSNDTSKPFMAKECTIKRKDGEFRIISKNADFLKDVNGNVIAGIESFEDITERRHAEEELIKAVGVKSDFISMVSHELRTPLTGIREGICIILDGLLGGLTQQQNKLLDMVKKNVDRLARLINGVLDFQKLEAGKIGWNMIKNDINEVVKESYQSMLPVVEDKGLNFTLTLEKNLPKIIFDKDKIMQVMINLVNNAGKFTEKGTIAITTVKDNNSIHVMVKDTGEGIREEDMPRLFRTFEQMGKPNERKVGGSGLGLSISKKIILHHKGKIWAESKFGKGSVFHFSLPINA